MFDIWGVAKGFIGLFFDSVRSLAAGLVGRVLGTLGIGFASYNWLLPQIVDYINQYLVGLPDWALQMISALRIDQALTLVFSALAWKMGTKVRPIRVGGTDAAP